MQSLGADLSETELQDLEKRFAGPSVSHRGSIMNGRRGGEEEGVRYVELLRWAAPDRTGAESGQEVSTKFTGAPRKLSAG